MGDLLNIIPKKELFLTWTKEEKKAILQLRKILKTMLKCKISSDPLVIRFGEPLTDLTIITIKNAGYTTTVEEIQVPEEYTTRHGYKRTRLLVKYELNIS